MRLEGDEPIRAALEAGIPWLDTAHAYPGNEERLARVIAAGRVGNTKIITKVGMLRPNGGWEPDGRAKTILAQARESAERLGRPPDILMLHAPDPNVSLATSMRALAKAREAGLAHAIGLSNPTRRELDELEVPIAAVEVALGPKHDGAARAGIVTWCRERDIPLFAHSPLGGVAHAPKLARDTALSIVAKRHGASPAEVMLAYLLALDSRIVPIPGARRVETVESCVRAAELVLTEEDLAILDERFETHGRKPPRPPTQPTAEVVIVMGVPGAGKTRLVAEYGDYERLNRDTLGGTLAGIAKRLEATLKSGTPKVVLDNTYLTRAARSDVIRVAHRAGALVRCVHVDISLEDARINVAQRMLERYEKLLGGTELKQHGRKDPNLLLPTPLAKLHRSIEPPANDEGFASIDRRPFQRDAGNGRRGIAIPYEGIGVLPEIPKDVPILVFGWKPSAVEQWQRETEAALAVDRPLMLAFCTHSDGPPECWCRPPLPGLWLAFALRFGVDAAVSSMLALSPTQRTMAAELGLSLL
jgi:aryl-alcohol dehydrogenase-like predicted oxidoreductase